MKEQEREEIRFLLETEEWMAGRFKEWLTPVTILAAIQGAFLTYWHEDGKNVLGEMLSLILSILIIILIAISLICIRLRPIRDYETETKKIKIIGNAWFFIILFVFLDFIISICIILSRFS